LRQSDFIQISRGDEQIDRTGNHNQDWSNNLRNEKVY
jgi:hypothetical protein